MVDDGHDGTQAGYDDGRGAAGDELSRVEKALAGRYPHRMIPDLERMRDLVDLLGHPERSFPVIHITGTNGKTSTARMIESLARVLVLRRFPVSSSPSITPSA